MGRFYKTTKPTFVENNMYTPPIELMKGFIKTVDDRNDKLIKQSEILEGAVDTIKHLNNKTDNELVKEIQEKYKTKVDDITESIYKDPLNYQDKLQGLKKLKREMVTDKTSGNWYNIEQRYNDYKEWVKDNKNLRESNPTLYNKANQHWLNELADKTEKDPNARFAGQKIIDKPDLIKDYYKYFNHIKSNVIQRTDGKYIYKNEVVTENEIARIAWDTLMADKNYKGYINQMGNVFGEKGYVDENGNPTPGFILVDEKNNPISYDDYKKLPEEEQKKVRMQLNPKNPFYPELSSIARVFGFQNQTMAPNQYGVDRMKHYWRTIEEKQRQDDRLKFLEEQYKNKLALAIEKANLNPTNKNKNEVKKAEKNLKDFQTSQSIVTAGNPKNSLEEDSNILYEHVRTMEKIPDEATSPEAQRFINATKYARNKLENQTITLSNGYKVNATDYIDFLTRNHLEEMGKSREYLAREYLATKGQILIDYKEFLNYYYDKGYNKHPEWEESTKPITDIRKEFIEKKRKDLEPFFKEHKIDPNKAEIHILNGSFDNARWLHKFFKTEGGKNWDKIYKIGKEYNKFREQWYENYNDKTFETAWEPINEEATEEITALIKDNLGKFNVVDEKGEIVSGYQNMLKKKLNGQQLFAIDTDAWNVTGLGVKIDGKIYYIHPTFGNEKVTETTRKLSMKGVDKNSTYFKHMSNRYATYVENRLQKAGSLNGKYRIKEIINGQDVIINKSNGKYHVEEPNGKIIKSYNNLNNLLITAYKKTKK